MYITEEYVICTAISYCVPYFCDTMAETVNKGARMYLEIFSYVPVCMHVCICVYVCIQNCNLHTNAHGSVIFHEYFDGGLAKHQTYVYIYTIMYIYYVNVYSINNTLVNYLMEQIFHDIGFSSFKQFPSTERSNKHTYIHMYILLKFEWYGLYIYPC